MRPTTSIILFTVLSGTGCGLWFLLGLVLISFGWGAPPLPSGDAWPLDVLYPPGVACALVAAFVLVTAGLFASLAHLGKPLRAWRALSQWRTSWLSREGVAALAACLVALILIAIFVDGRPAWLVRTGVLPIALLGLLLAVFAAATVVCTAKIYATLAPIRAWNNRFVVGNYVVLALYGGALAFWCFVPRDAANANATSPLLSALAAIAALAAVQKLRYWNEIDGDEPIATAHAIGLAAQGAARSFEAPHTEENYLLREMGFVLARKHASKLRAIALAVGFALPALLALIAALLPGTRIVAAWPAMIAGLVGLLVERWLFFAEARHSVAAYYARD